MQYTRRFGWLCYPQIQAFQNLQSQVWPVKTGCKPDIKPMFGSAIDLIISCKMGAGKMVSKKLTLPLCLALCGAIASTSYADTYRWVDTNGIVNYAEQKPRGVPAGSITTVSDSRSGSQRTRALEAQSRSAVPPTPFVADANPGTKSQPRLSPSQQDLLSDLQENEADRLAQINQVREDNCERSRRVLTNLTAKERIRVRSDTGIERVLPEDERQQRISDAQRGIAENCSA